MEMKEFHYQDGLRVSLFNLDHKAVPYHFHNEVSDMMYCSRGQITIELPDTDEVFTVHPDQVFQVPHPSKHRFVNGAPVGTPSRYVLLQIGDFDINFVPAAKDIAGNSPSAPRRRSPATPFTSRIARPTSSSSPTTSNRRSRGPGRGGAG